MAIFGVGWLMLLDLFCAFMWGVLADSVVWARGLGSLAPDPDFNWPFELLLIGLGVAILGWIQYRIWWPRVVIEGAGVASAAAFRFPVLTNHPWYALIDLAWAPFFFVEEFAQAAPPAAGGYVDPAAIRSAMLGRVDALGMTGLLLLVAFTRVVAWVVFRRRVDAEQARRAWVPVAMLGGFFALLGVAIVIVDAVRG